MITASGYERAAICPASAVLPSVRSVSEAASRGTAGHAFLVDYARHGRDVALANAPEELRGFLSVVDTERLPLNASMYVAELAMAYDVVTGKAREIGRDIGRNYGHLGASEMAGTADVIGVGLPSVFVYDFKFGRTPMTPARRNGQMRLLALMACRLYGATRATVALIHVEPDGGVWYDTAEFDEFEIDAIDHELRESWKRIGESRERLNRGEHPDYVTGDHCRWCPAMTGCHAQTALIRAVASAQSSDVPTETALGFPVVGDLTPEAASRAWVGLKSLKALVRRAESQLHGFARAVPFAVPGGRMVGEVETAGRPEYDAATVRRILVDRFGPDVAEAACEFTTSGAAIERAIKPLATERGTFAPLKKEIMAAIASAGGISRPTTRRVEEYDPAKEE